MGLDSKLIFTRFIEADADGVTRKMQDILSDFCDNRLPSVFRDFAALPATVKNVTSAMDHLVYVAVHEDWRLRLHNASELAGHVTEQEIREENADLLRLSEASKLHAESRDFSLSEEKENLKAFRVSDGNIEKIFGNGLTVGDLLMSQPEIFLQIMGSYDISVKKAGLLVRLLLFGCGSQFPEYQIRIYHRCQ